MLSIIIPVLNQRDMTLECIEAIRETTQDCEIIIVDNGSTPPFKAPFTGYIETTVISNKENKGFPAAVNQGIRAAKGDVIILLNNDVIVTPGWAGMLTAALENFSIVGPVTNYAAGMQKVQAEAYTSKDELNKAAAHWAEEVGGEIQEVNFVIGFCMAFRGSLKKEIGYWDGNKYKYFDDSLWPCSGEEVDFCFRARSGGYRIGIVTGCYVHHEGSKTFQDMQESGAVDYVEVCKRNDEHLEAKWGKNYWERQAINSPVEPVGTCLNLGCGYRHLEGFINIDNRAAVAPDSCCDVMAGLPYSDNCVDLVRANDFLEHIPIGSVIGVIEDIWRVLKPGGIFESSTPSTDGRGAFQDPTHVSFWNRNSWLYYSVPEYRKLYGIKADFEIESIEEGELVHGMGIIHTHVIARARK